MVHWEIEIYEPNLFRDYIWDRIRFGVWVDMGARAEAEGTPIVVCPIEACSDSRHKLQEHVQIEPNKPTEILA